MMKIKVLSQKILSNTHTHTHTHTEEVKGDSEVVGMWWFLHKWFVLKKPAGWKTRITLHGRIKILSKTWQICLLRQMNTSAINKTLIVHQVFPSEKLTSLTLMNIMLQLHWSENESESDVAWNGHRDSPVACLHWSESNFAWKLGCNPFWTDVARDVSLSLQYNCTLSLCLMFMNYAIQNMWCRICS